MIKLDSLKLKIPANHVTYNPAKFKRLLNTETGVIESEAAQGLESVIGLKSIQVQTDSVVIELSAKILHKDYLKGISDQNIHHVLETVHNTGFIQFKDVQKVYNSSEVLRCDVNSMVYVDSIQHVLYMLNQYAVNPDWNVDYQKTSITFRRDVKTKPMRMIGYCKYSELMTAKNRNLITRYPAILREAKNGFRIETNLKSFDKIRENLSINDIRLKSVLASGENVNLNMLNKITDMKLKPMVRTFTNKREHGKYKEARQVLQECNFDLEVCKTNLLREIPTLDKDNISRYINQYEAYAIEIQKDILQEKGIDSDSLLTDLKEKLHTEFDN